MNGAAPFVSSPGLPSTATGAAPNGTSRPLPYRRVVVVGITGSGKSTLAAQLAQLQILSHVELDALFWDANWTHASDEVFRARIIAALPDDGWVADGNYWVARDLIWRQADTLIWLDYPLRVNLWRLTVRTLRRVYTGEDLWNGNRERFRTQFLSRESLFLWAWISHRHRRRQYTDLLAQPEHAHLRVVHHFSPRSTDRWLDALRKGAGNGNRTRAFSLGS